MSPIFFQLEWVQFCNCAEFIVVVADWCVWCWCGDFIFFCFSYDHICFYVFHATTICYVFFMCDSLTYFLILFDIVFEFDIDVSDARRVCIRCVSDVYRICALFLSPHFLTHVLFFEYLCWTFCGFFLPSCFSILF